jgi:CheY-like chemotaxis protein
VLLVEDTISQQKLMSKWLHGQGCEVVCAVNGKIGLELLKTKQFDIAFIDFLMVRNASFDNMIRENSWYKSRTKADIKLKCSCM